MVDTCGYVKKMPDPRANVHQNMPGLVSGIATSERWERKGRERVGSGSTFPTQALT